MQRILFGIQVTMLKTNLYLATDIKYLYLKVDCTSTQFFQLKCLVTGKKIIEWLLLAV